MPVCNAEAMNHHLAEISAQVAPGAQAVLLSDGAAWHDAAALVVPTNITLLPLPSYSPELNPAERIWRYFRKTWLANSVFHTLADIFDACEQAWKRFAAMPDLIASLCHVEWAVSPPETL
jgi:hypothetical protein